MSGSERPDRYSTTAIVLHWLIAVAVVAQIGFGWWMLQISKDPVGPRVNAFNLHKSIGLTLLALVAIRLAWRATHRPPALPPMPAWQMLAARLNHGVLYACLLVQPLSGYVGSAVSGYPVRYFGIMLPAWAPKDVALKDALSVVHFASSWILVAAIGLHVAAALKHQLVDRDRLLQRIWF